MGLPTNIDMAVLRTLVTGCDGGSFANAATRLARSPSAISSQLQKLEAQVGRDLFRREGRRLALTEAGELLLGYARRMLELNDEALDAVRGPQLHGSVRVGVPQDIAETSFPAILARFARVHPEVRVSARVDRNAVLLHELAVGSLDLALTWNPSSGSDDAILDLPMSWVGPRSAPAFEADRPLALVLFEPPCVFRSAGIAALDAASIPWRVSFTSPSLSGLWAAVAAGLGITLRTPLGLPASLNVLPARDRLPILPRIRLELAKSAAAGSKAIDHLEEIIRESLKPASVRENHTGPCERWSTA